LSLPRRVFKHNSPQTERRGHEA